MNTRAHPTSDRTRALEALFRSDGFQLGLRLLQYAIGVTVAGALLLVAVATVPVLFGYHTYVIEGGSMEPTLKVGSVAVTKPTTPAQLDIGDIVAYRRSIDSTPVLHRIVEVTTVDGHLEFITQGDRNASPDAEPVQLVGLGDRVIYSVPYAGYILNFGATWPGRALLLGVPLLGLCAQLLRDRGPRQPNPVERAAEAVGQRRRLAAFAPRPAAGEGVRLVLTYLPAFSVLMDAVEALSDLPAVAAVAVVEFRDGEAVVELRLRDRLTPAEVVQRLRDGTGLAVVREAPPRGQPRLRFVTGPERAERSRAA